MPKYSVFRRSSEAKIPRDEFHENNQCNIGRISTPRFNPLGQDRELPMAVLFLSIDDFERLGGLLGWTSSGQDAQYGRLGQAWSQFTNAHCSVPVCTSSRNSVMSGIGPMTHGSYEIGPKYEQLPALADAPTIQRYFKSHGYYSLSGGKVLHHGFGARLSGDIDQSLGQAWRRCASQETDEPSGKLERSVGLGRLIRKRMRRWGIFNWPNLRPWPSRKTMTNLSSCPSGSFACDTLIGSAQMVQAV